MTNIEEEDLPGIGKKFSLTTLAGGSLTIVIHNEGRRDVYYAKDEDEDPFVFTLTDEEARKVSTILGNAYFKPTLITSAKQALSEELKAIRVPSGAGVLDKKIKDLDIRKRTGASIVSIIRGDEIIKNPSATMVIQEGDLLMVMGTKESVEKLEKMVTV